MKRTLIFFVAGTLISMLIGYFTHSVFGMINVYKAAAFGLGWGMAYYVDEPERPLPKKLGISFIGIIILVLIGIIFYDFETAIPSIIKFSTVFVAYYLIASFRDSKSLKY